MFSTQKEWAVLVILDPLDIRLNAFVPLFYRYFP